MSYKIVFAGTPDFAVPSLHALLAAGHEVRCVYTQPDRAAGRGRKLAASPVKQAALAAGLAVLQPSTLRGPEAAAQLQAFAADLMVVAAYGLILPPAILAAPALGCLNVHASLLPRWRGAAPIQRAIIAGDTETGITIMQMDQGLDTGAMLTRRACAITASDSGGSLHDRLARLGADALIYTLDRMRDGKLDPIAQAEDLATYAAKLDKHEAWIDWSLPAAQIERRIRAFDPWPVAQTRHAGDVFRIWQARAESAPPTSAPGTVSASAREGMVVACGTGSLRVLVLQAAGRKRLTAAEFLNARTLDGVRFEPPPT